MRIFAKKSVSISFRSFSAIPRRCRGCHGNESAAGGTTPTRDSPSSHDTHEDQAGRGGRARKIFMQEFLFASLQ